MIKAFRWIKEKLFHKKKDDEILRSIEQYKQLTRDTDKKLTKFIAALDGEVDWFKNSCRDNNRFTHKRSTDQ